MSIKTHQILHFKYVIYDVSTVSQLKSLLIRPGKNKYWKNVLNMTFPYTKLKSPHFVTIKIVYNLIHNSKVNRNMWC